jgi:hypothetical protein
MQQAWKIARRDLMAVPAVGVPPDDLPTDQGD